MQSNNNSAIGHAITRSEIFDMIYIQDIAPHDKVNKFEA